VLVGDIVFWLLCAPYWVFQPICWHCSIQNSWQLKKKPYELWIISASFFQCEPPFPQIEIIKAVVTVWRVTENYQVHSVQYYVQQSCTVTRMWTDLTVVCWLGLAFLWSYCVLQFICARFSFLGLFCYSLVVYVCSCYSVRFSFFSTIPRNWLGRTSVKWPTLCRVGHKYLNSVNQSVSL